MPKYKINQFDGGITDFIYKFEDKFTEECDNLVINKNLGLVTRFGQSMLSDSYPQVPTEDRVTKIFEFQDDVIIKSLDKLYTLSTSAGYTEITDDSVVSASTIALVNNLKSVINVHYADEGGAVTEHTDPNPLIVGADATDTPSVLLLTVEIQDSYVLHDADAAALAQTYHRGQAVANSLVSTVNPTTVAEAVAILNDIKAKLDLHMADGTSHEDGDSPSVVADDAVVADSRSVFYNHGAEDYVDHAIINNQIVFTSTEYKFRPLLTYKSVNYGLSTLGLPELANTPTVTPAGGGDTVSYVYAFIYYREYTSNGLTFEEVGTPVYVGVESAAAVAVDGSNPYSITDIPVLTNSSSTFWKLSLGSEDVKVKIYRTTDNGSVFFYLGDSAGLISNGDTTASDNVPDEDLALNTILYTEGGVVSNDAPPISKYVTVANEIAWYGNTIDAPNRIRQSKKLQPGACPEDYYIDVDDTITGIATTRDFPIVFTDNKVFRIEGFIDNLGRGDIQKKVITDRVGCINHRTITQTRAGVYFASSSGWFFTDGYSLQAISEQLERRYPELLVTQTTINRMSGAYLGKDQRVFFPVQEGADNDKMYVYDESYGAWTTMSGQQGFNPTAIGTFKTQLIRADDNGYLYKFDDNVLVDPVPDTTLAVTNWRTQAIIYNFKHIALSMGDLRSKKWTTKVNLQIDNRTGQHVDVGSFDERTYDRRELKPIIVTGSLPWGATGTAWGVSEITWGGNEMISRTRRFPAGKIRTRYKQLSLTNYRTVLFNSTDSLGNATPSNSTKFVDLDNALKSWPSDVVGESIRFGTNTREFEVLERISDTRIRVSDPSNLLIDVSASWEILGYKKSESFDLQVITYTYVDLSDRGSYYDSDSDGGGER